MAVFGASQSRGTRESRKGRDVGATASQRLMEDFGLRTRSPREFLRSADDLDEGDRPLPRAHAIRQAWQHLDLNGVLCANAQPIAYFKEVEEPLGEEDARNLQGGFWNHGVCPVLVVTSARNVEVYSARALPARPDEDPRSPDRLLQILRPTVEQLRNLTARIETGRILEDLKRFRPERAVDEYLLRNLRDTRQRLIDSGSLDDLPTIHALLGRTIFASYLAQRKIINGPFFDAVGAEGTTDVVELLSKFDPPKAHQLLFRLFNRLQKPFKGSLFSEDIDAEVRRVQPEHMPILRRFLQGHEVASGQLTLFSLYDFGVIPVELISAIYEDFIQAEGEDRQRESGAYYTPPQLAELVVDVATEGHDSLLGKRFLDPACGSGMFLVTVFNRLAEEWRRRHPRARNATRAKGLSEILENNLVGIDVNKTACRIACFSLYLALLDQLKPRDIQELAEKGTLLPELLDISGKAKGDKRSQRSIRWHDFFESKPPLESNFDFVIGNPPWVSRGKTSDNAPPVRWCRERKLPIPQKQIALAFMWKCPEHTEETGRICLLVPSIVLLGQTDDFQRQWMTNYAVERVVQLADMRFLLFAHAIRPASIVCYRPVPSTEECLVHDSPTTEFPELRASVLSLWPQDRKRLPLKDILEAAARKEAGVVWKSALWATPRDRRFLDRLLQLPRLKDITGTPKQGKRWIKGQGLQPLGKNDEPTGEPEKMAWWDADHSCLRADEGKFSFDLVLTTDDCTTVGPAWSELRRLPDRRLFSAPLVVFNQGFSRIAFSDFDVLFHHSVQSISGLKDDHDLLAFLVAYLQSPLARYFEFHTASYWGIERDKVSLFEVLRLPFPLPEEAPDPSAAKHAVGRATAVLKRLQQKLEQPLSDRESLVSSARDKLAALVYEYFDVDEFETILIDDTVRHIVPSSTPNRGAVTLPTLTRSSGPERRHYVELVCKILNEWGRRSGEKISGKTVVSSDSDLGIVTLSKDRRKERYKEEAAHGALAKTLGHVRSLLTESHQGLAYMRNVKVFDGTCLHIVKPLAFRHWMKSAALNDADEIASAVLTGGPHGDQR